LPDYSAMVIWRWSKTKISADGKKGAGNAHFFVDGARICFDWIRQMACFAFEANEIN